MKTIKVNFNHIDEEGLTVGFIDNASHRLFIGDMVLAIDTERNACLASVAAVEYSGVVKLQLDQATVQSEQIPA